MRHRIHASYVLRIALVIELCLPSSTTSGQETRPRLEAGELSGERIYDELVTPAGGGMNAMHFVLAVSRDDALTVSTFIEVEGKERASREIDYYLGQRVTRSGDLDLERLLPTGEVATAAYRFTRGPIARYHVILTWAFDKDDPAGPNGHVHYNIYVITENRRTKSAKVTYREIEINEQLIHLLVRDLGGDGYVEIVDIGREAAYTTVKVRILDPEGRVTLVQTLDDSYNVLVVGELWALEPLTLLLEQKADSNDPRGVRCYADKAMQWSREKRQFVPMSKKGSD
jgi:hypothetical protein